MVFKILQKFPLSLKSLFFQAFFSLFLFALLWFFGLGLKAFWAGFIFSQIYMLLFFYSAYLIFDQKYRRWGVFLLFIKWLFLLFLLFCVSWFLDSKSFLIGLSGTLSFLLCYVLERLKANSGNTKFFKKSPKNLRAFRTIV